MLNKPSPMVQNKVIAIILSLIVEKIVKNANSSQITMVMQYLTRKVK